MDRPIPKMLHKFYCGSTAKGVRLCMYIERNSYQIFFAYIKQGIVHEGGHRLNHEH